MANIRNSISLQDRMTPVFRNILKSMDSTMRVMRQLDKQANKGAQSKAYRAAERDLKRANNELIKMQNNLSRCDKEADHLARSTSKVSFSSAGAGLSSFITGLSSALYLAKNIAAALSGIMETPDTMRAIQYRLGTYDTTGATGSQLMDAAYQAAQASRSDLQSTADLASRILISGATKGSGAEAINIAGILNKASFLGGSSSQESQRALLQLSQGLASGALQGDELRAIREQAPGLTDTLAKGLSRLGEKGLLPEKFIGTTMGDLKELGSEGELTSQRIIAAFKEMEDYVDTTFKDSPKQFGQAAAGILNVWKRWLKLMGEGDNALAKINEKVWDLLEWFESPAGDEFFTNLANGVNFVTNCILQLIDWVGELISWFNGLDNSIHIVEAALIALALTIVGVAVVAIAQFIAQWWKVILVVAIIAIIIYALLELGLTVSQIVGGIVGGIAFLAILIYDIVVWVLTIVNIALMMIKDAIVFIFEFIINLVLAIVLIIIEAVAIILQIIMWIITTICAAIKIIGLIIGFVANLTVTIIKGAVSLIYNLFVGLAESVLAVLWGIASVIDFIFGSHLADTVGGWMENLAGSVEDLNDSLDIGSGWEDYGREFTTVFKDIGDQYAGNGQYDDWNITDNMMKNADSFFGASNDVHEWLNPAYATEDQYWDAASWGVEHGTANPMNGWNAGMDFGDKLENGLTDFSTQMEELREKIESGDFLDGGKLDSIGSIGSDVELSDEDIQLLRDVAARDFLLTLQTSAPQVNNNFGDIKETADVNKILEVIQDMVDEQLAVSLVVE